MIDAFFCIQPHFSPSRHLPHLLSHAGLGPMPPHQHTDFFLPSTLLSRSLCLQCPL